MRFSDDTAPPPGRSSCAHVPQLVLFQHVKEGVGELDQAKLPHLLELKYRAVSDAAAQLGGVAQIRDAFIGFQRQLF
jgi:type I restriction enzyme, R subunit